MLKNNILNLLLVILIFTLDRLSKIIIIKLSEPLGDLNISVTPFINFSLIWNEGIAEVNYVMHHFHEAFNLSDKSMEILFIDVKIDTEVEL